MYPDLQKANTWKRFAAWILDAILFCIVVTMCGFLVSFITGYDAKNEKLEQVYTSYEEKYNIDFDKYDHLSEEEQKRYEEAINALNSDQEAMHAYSVVVSLTLLITSLGIFFACLILEFFIPLVLKNGQTLGKKVFGIGVMMVNGVRIRPVVLFVRALIGKYTIEIMIPVLIAIMIFFGNIGIIGVVVLILLLLLQLGLIIFTHTNSAIHDALASTVTVDLSSQRIFESEDEMIEYKKKIAAEIAERQEY